MRHQYSAITNITRLINNGHKNAIPIIDNNEELDLLQAGIKGNKIETTDAAVDTKFVFEFSIKFEIVANMIERNAFIFFYFLQILCTRKQI